MSGRVLHLRDGEWITNRKTDRRQSLRTPANQMAAWRLSFDIPPQFGLLAAGAVPGMFGTRVTALNRIEITGRRKPFVTGQLAKVLELYARGGLISPLAVVLERGDEPGPTLSGPIRKGIKAPGHVTYDGHVAWLTIGTSTTQIVRTL